MTRRVVLLIGVVFVALCFGLFALLIARFDRRQAEEHAKLHEQQNAKAFAAVKAGDTNVSIHSPDLIIKLADDKVCVRNLTSVYFFMTDLGDPRFEQTERLSNVEEIGIYGCSGVDKLLKSIDGMPSIKKFHFESFTVSDDVLHSLKSFPELTEVRFEQLLDQDQLELLARELSDVSVLVPDPVTGEPTQIPNRSPKASL